MIASVEPTLYSVPVSILHVALVSETDTVAVSTGVSPPPPESSFT